MIPLLSSALVFPLIGKLSDYIENRYLLLLNCWGMALVLLTFPHITDIHQVCMIQVVLGILGAFQKHGEKMVLANYTDITNRGKKIGNYHFWTVLFSSIAIMSAGVFADFFTIDAIFYSSSILYFVGGFLLISKTKGELHMNKSPVHSKIGATFIPVSDIERSREWYCKILGREVEGEILFGHLYVLPLEGENGLVLDSKIFSERSIGEAPLFHFNTDNIQAAYNYLKNYGVSILTEIENGHWFKIVDPDGNVLMIAQC
jgi:catechol 2,3-dioxygenase-like lactoylglutathione lyase family enzyme